MRRREAQAEEEEGDISDSSVASKFARTALGRAPSPAAGSEGAGPSMV